MSTPPNVVPNEDPESNNHAHVVNMAGQSVHDEKLGQNLVPARTVGGTEQQTVSPQQAAVDMPELPGQTSQHMPDQRQIHAEANIVERSSKELDAMSAPIQSDELWVYYQPFLTWRVLPVFLSALILIFSFAWLYLGAVWDPLSKTPDLKVAVMNCDAGVNASLLAQLPPTVAMVAQQYTQVPLSHQLLARSIWNPASSTSQLLDWRNHTCSHAAAPGSWGCGDAATVAACRDEMISSIQDSDYWSALFITSNFTLNHLSWYKGANVSGMPAAQTSVVIEQLLGKGRSYSTYSYLTPIVDKIIQGVSVSFGLGLANGPAMQLLIPSALVQPVQLTTTDLAPVVFFGQNMASYVFCILLWLGSAFAVGVSNQYKMPAEIVALNTTDDKRPSRLALLQAALLKASCLMLFMWIVVVLLNVVVLALGHGDSDYDRNPGYSMAFGWYLSWSFLSLNGFLLHLLGIERFNSLSAFLLILQLMSSGGIFSEELSNRFFNIGHGLPFYYGVRGFRTIFFGSEQHLMWINWLVITAYNVLAGIAALAFVTHRMHTAGARARPRLMPGGPNSLGEVVMAGAGV